MEEHKEHKADFRTLTAQQVCDLLQISSPTLLKLSKRPDFPKSMKIGRVNRWNIQDIQDWFEKEQVEQNKEK